MAEKFSLKDLANQPLGDLFAGTSTVYSHLN